MRALVQRVSRAEVRLPQGEPRQIGAGLLVLLGVAQGDTEAEARRLADKALALRIFSNESGKFDRSVADEKGGLLVISQFTLYGDPWNGRRPDFTRALEPGEAKRLYEVFVGFVRASGLEVQTGEFGAKMAVESVNEGPVTLWLDTADA